MFYRIKNNKVIDFSVSNYIDDCIETDLCTCEEYAKNFGKFIVGEVEEEIDVPDYETVTEEYEDENGEIQTNEVQKPVMIEVEETIIVPIYDDETGEKTGEEEKTIKKLVPQTHKETITVQRLVLNPDWEEIKEKLEKERIGNLKVTKRVFALALQQFGITYAQLKEAIAQNEQAQLEWDLCVELERKNPLLDAMAVQFDVTPKQLDYIFRKANGEEIDEL